jgi:hypothetical protein
MLISTQARTCAGSLCSMIERSGKPSGPKPGPAR